MLIIFVWLLLSATIALIVLGVCIRSPRGEGDDLKLNVIASFIAFLLWPIALVVPPCRKLYLAHFTRGAETLFPGKFDEVSEE